MATFFNFTMFVIFIGIITLGSFGSESKPSMSASNDDLDKYRQAVVETAYQYYYRGRALQYDGTYLNYQSGNARIPRSGALTLVNGNNWSLAPTTFYSPEEATTQDIHYFVCSHFVTAVYGETFVYNDNNKNKNKSGNKYEIHKPDGKVRFDTTFLKEVVLEWKKEKEDGKDVIYLFPQVKTTNGLSEMIKKGTLLPGDILLRMGGEGIGSHAMLYVGNGKILHSTGINPNNESNSNLKNVQSDAYVSAAVKINNKSIPYGNYRYESKMDIIETESRVLNTTKNDIGTIYENCIDISGEKCDYDYDPVTANGDLYVIRIINSQNNEMDLSDNAKSRISAKGIVIDKKVTIGDNKTTGEKSIEKYHSVNLGDIINYVIRVENKSEIDYTGDNDKIIITEKIPEKTSYIDNKHISDVCKLKNNTIVCEFNLKAKAARTVYIRLKVSNNRRHYGLNIESNGGKVEIKKNGNKIYSVPTKNISTPINRTLSNSDRALLISKANAKNGEPYTKDSRKGLSNELISEIYKDYGILLPTATELFNAMEYKEKDKLDIYKTIRDSEETYYKDFREITQIREYNNKYENFKLFKLENLKKLNDGKYYNMVVPGLFGGILTTSDNEKPGMRNNTYHNDTLLVGDVLYVYDSNAANDNMKTGNNNNSGGYVKGVANAYLYLGNGNFVTVSDGIPYVYDKYKLYNKNYLYMYSPNRKNPNSKITEPIEIDLSKSTYTSVSMGTRLLTSLLGQDCYVVLRPSYAIQDTVTEISVLEQEPYKYKDSYIQNQEQLDLSEGRLKITYGNYGYYVMRLDDKSIKVSGFNNSKLGEQTLNISYGGKTTKIKVNVVAQKELTGIAIKSPNKLTYIQNEDNLDLNGGVLLLKYSDNSTIELKMTDSSVKSSGFDNKKLGRQEITIEYKGIKESFYILVEAASKKVSNFEISKSPNKLVYTQNLDSLDLTGGTAKITYTDSTTETISMTSSKLSVSDFDNSKEGKQTIKITYSGKTVSFDVTVKSRYIESIKVVKTQYATAPNGEKRVDLTLSEMEVYYSDGTTEIVNLSSPNIKVNNNNLVLEVDYYGVKDYYNISADEEKSEETTKKVSKNPLIILCGLFIVTIIGAVVFLKKQQGNI